MKYVPYYLKDGKFKEEINGSSYGIENPFNRGSEKKFYIHEDMSAGSIKSIEDAGYIPFKIPAATHERMFGCVSCGNRTSFEFNVVLEQDVEISPNGSLTITDAGEVMNTILNHFVGVNQLAVMNLLASISKRRALPADPNEVFIIGKRREKESNYEPIPIYGSLVDLMDRHESVVMQFAEKNDMHVECCSCGGDVFDFKTHSGYSDIAHSCGNQEDEDFLDNTCGGCAICTPEAPNQDSVLDRCAQCIGIDFGMYLAHINDPDELDEDGNAEEPDDLVDYLSRYFNRGLCGDRDCGNLQHIDFFGLDQFGDSQFPRIHEVAQEILDDEEAEMEKEAANSKAKTMGEIVDA